MNIPASGAILGVAVLPDETILGIGMDRQLYTRATLNSGWVHVPNSGPLIAVMAGTVLDL